MKTVQIKYAEPQWWEQAEQPISVIVNGLCNHNDYRYENEEETDEYQGAVTGNSQPTYHYQIMICNRCEAFKHTDGIIVEGWQDEHFEDEENE